jgi:ABC-type glycerol-3-phosphate transport system permease component
VIPRVLRRVGARVGYYGLLSLIALFALAPALWVVLSSFKSGTQVLSSGAVLPSPWTLRGYRDAFEQVNLHRHLLNTALYAGGGMLGAMAIALLAAYPLARFQFAGRNAMVTMFSIALAIPIIGLATPEFFIMRELGLYDTRLGLVVFYSALLFPLSFVILRAFLVNLPSEVEEAARVDGAGYFTVLRRVVIPLSRPALATVAVIAFVSIWNEFFFANLFTASIEKQNAQLALASFRTLYGFNSGATLAGATLTMLVPVLAFLLLQRHVVEGLTAGSTK